MKRYIMNNSIEARIEEVNEKVAALRRDMIDNGWHGIYIRKSENFAWITAGGDNIVTRYVEDGVCAILITIESKYFICSNNESLRMKEEEHLDQLGFTECTMMWYEDRTMEFINTYVHGAPFASDIRLPGALDANAVLMRRELSLCENEIARYLYMGQKFAEVIENFMLTVRPGDTEQEIAGRLSAHMWEKGLEPVLFLVATDERIYKYRHPIPTTKRLEKLLMISCNCRYKGLITKITRMAHIGKIPQALQSQYRQNLEIENTLAVATKPGIDDLLLFNRCRELYAEMGYPDMWQMHHQGGPESYTNGFYLVSDANHMIVPENCCYGYNPSITGTKTEDGFIVTEDGPLFITPPIVFPVIESEIDGIKLRRPGILELGT